MANISQVGIVNLALANISAGTIQSLSEGSTAADAALVIYTPLLEEVLETFNWRFARVVRVLTLISDYEPLKFTYGYQYPSNCIKLHKVYEEGTADMGIGEKFEEVYDVDNGRQVIETDIEDAYGEYTYNVTDTTKFSWAFITAFAHRLAAPLAMALNADKKVAEGQMNIYNALISDAKKKAHKGYNPRAQTSSFVSARA